MQPKTYKSLVLSGTPNQYSVKELLIPSLGDGQVLVKIDLAGLCRSQLMEVEGARGEDIFLPHGLGHEGVGTVVDIGNNVTKVKNGDRVVLGWLKSSGLDAGGSKIRTTSGEIINVGPVTTFSEYSVVSENRVTKVGCFLSDELAVLLGCALPTGMGLVVNEVKPLPMTDLIIVGLGGIGLSALIALRNYSLRNIAVFDENPAKLEMAKHFGANYTFCGKNSAAKMIKEIFPGGFDYAIEAAGSCSTIEFAFDCIKADGKCFFASHPPSGQKISIDPHDLISGKQIFGSWGGGFVPDRDTPSITKLLSGVADLLPRYMSKRFSLYEFDDALEALKSGVFYRVLIDPKIRIEHLK